MQQLLIRSTILQNEESAWSRRSIQEVDRALFLQQVGVYFVEETLALLGKVRNLSRLLSKLARHNRKGELIGACHAQGARGENVKNSILSEREGKRSVVPI